MPPRATRHAAISRPVRKADSDAALVASRSCARSGRRKRRRVDGAERPLARLRDDRRRPSVHTDPFEARVERGGELRGDHGADRCGREQAGDAGDRVVDRRGDPGVALVGVREHGGGQRRHRHRQPEREDQQRRQHVGQERRVGREPREPQDAARRDERPEAHERARADAVGQRAEATRQQEHHDRAGHGGQPRLDRLVARDLLQVEDEQEEHDAEARVHRERQQVADREVAPPEQVQVEHRMRCVRLPQHERAEQRDADDPRAEDERIAPAPQRLRDERQDRARQPERAQHRADDVHPRARLRRAADLDPARQRQRHEDEGHVDGEDRAPRRDVDEPPADERADDERDPAPRRPGADRRAALVTRERRDDERERARRQQRAERALQRPAEDEHADRRRERRR